VESIRDLPGGMRGRPGSAVPVRSSRSDDFILLAGSAIGALVAPSAEYLDCDWRDQTLRSPRAIYSYGFWKTSGPRRVPVQGTAFPRTTTHGVAFWIDALKRASAASVPRHTLFQYAKGDKKDEPRVSIRARGAPTPIEAAAWIALSPSICHAPQVQASQVPGRRSVRHAGPLRRHRHKALADLVVVARMPGRQEGAPMVRTASRTALHRDKRRGSLGVR